MNLLLHFTPSLDLSPFVTNLSPEMLKIAYVCVRLLKWIKGKTVGLFSDFPGVTGVPEEGIEPTLTVK